MPDVRGLGIPHAAATYAAAGLPIFPVNPVTRRPLWTGWPELAAPDAAYWQAHPRAGIGLHPGGCGLVVIDVDEPDLLAAELAAELAVAPFQSSRPDRPGRGHYLLDAGGPMPNRNKSEMGWGDVKGRGGYVVLCPTPHAKGGEYRWIRIGPVLALADAPAVREAITRAAARQSHNGSSAAAPHATHRPPPRAATATWQWPPVAGLPPYYARAVAAECTAVVAAPSGDRNRRLADAAYGLGGYLDHPGMPTDAEHLIAAELIAAGVASGQDDDHPGQSKRTVALGLRVGRTRPRSLPRLRTPR